jgi:hypothetical protein
MNPNTVDRWFPDHYPVKAPPNPPDFAQFCADRRARQAVVANLFVPETRAIEPNPLKAARGIGNAIKFVMWFYAAIFVVWLIVRVL